MRHQVSKNDLQEMVRKINKVTESPLEPYIITNGKYLPQPGCYHLSWAYGGVCLERVCQDGNGIESIISGYGSKRELYDKMAGFLTGLRFKHVTSTLREGLLK